MKKKQENEKNVLELMLKQRAEILGLESYTVTKRPKKRIKQEVLNYINNDKEM